MKPQIPWLRVFVEGVVIVGSILLALGLDAWWDGVQERQREQAGLREILQNLAADSIDQESIRRSTLGYQTAALWGLQHLGRLGIESGCQ